mmetsp:Transcript_6766/g.18924  ORF Transcript_6766/g.18924 Transcript_6766/m.18924 type:complete len:224 (+) Transcript_6766:708-1379(+)
MPPRWTTSSCSGGHCRTSFAHHTHSSRMSNSAPRRPKARRENRGHANVSTLRRIASMPPTWCFCASISRTIFGTLSRSSMNTAGMRRWAFQRRVAGCYPTPGGILSAPRALRRLCRAAHAAQPHKYQNPSRRLASPVCSSVHVSLRTTPSAQRYSVILAHWRTVRVVSTRVGASACAAEKIGGMVNASAATRLVLRRGTSVVMSPRARVARGKRMESRARKAP